MLIEAYIISGFLGAGKTTLIQRMIKEVYLNQKVVIIENDFGETSMDAAMLRSKTIQVKELSKGCICCSLAGNFVEAMYQVIKDYFPDVILIEPSGVGKLSDVLKACNHPKIMPLLDQVRAITVVDVTTLQKYIKNYGEFFIDQLHYADLIWLSHTEHSKTSLEEIYKIISSYTKASVIMADKNKMIPDEIWNKTTRMSRSGKKERVPDNSRLRRNTLLNRTKHSANEVFDTYSVYLQAVFEKEEIKERFSLLEEGTYGRIIRAKGIVKAKNGYLCVQYASGKLTVEEVITKGNSLSFIGHNLQRQNLSMLFGGGSGQ